MSDETVWGWAESEHAEMWHGSEKTREGAIADARASGDFLPGDAVYVCSGRRPLASEFMPDIDWMIEQMKEAAYEEGGEAAEDFPTVSTEAREELASLLEAWMDKHLKVNFWVANGDVERIEPEEAT